MRREGSSRNDAAQVGHSRSTGRIVAVWPSGVAAGSGAPSVRRVTARSGEAKVIVRGLAALFVVAGLFGAGKLAFWQSTVVHEERSSVHRLFPGGVVVRFPQESLNAADLLTGGFLALAGVTALGISFVVGERVRSGASSVRTFFALAGAGLVWLGLDEVFLVHEFLSANLYVNDNWILLVYGLVGVVAAVAWQRVLRASVAAMAVMAAGALLHGGSLGLDFAQDVIGWAPEEPLEMLAAGLYALGMAAYFVRFALPGPGVGATQAQPQPDRADASTSSPALTP